MKTSFIYQLLSILFFTCWLNYSLYAQASFHVMSAKGLDLLNSIQANPKKIFVLEFKTDDSKNYYLVDSIYKQSSNSFISVPLTKLKAHLNEKKFVITTLAKYFKDSSYDEPIDSSKIYYLNPYIDKEIIKYQFSEKQESYPVSSELYLKIKDKYPLVDSNSITIDIIYWLYNVHLITLKKLENILSIAPNAKDFNPIPPKKAGN